MYQFFKCPNFSRHLIFLNVLILFTSHFFSYSIIYISSQILFKYLSSLCVLFVIAMTSKVATLRPKVALSDTSRRFANLAGRNKRVFSLFFSYLLFVTRAIRRFPTAFGKSEIFPRNKFLLLLAVCGNCRAQV